MPTLLGTDQPYLKSPDQNRLTDYVYDGRVRLWTYRSMERSSIDPKLFGRNRHTMNDRKRADYPRSFWYLDIREKENLFDNHTLHYCDFPAPLIYDILKDPDGIRESSKWGNTYDFQKMFQTIHQSDYKAAYYRPGFNVVVTFEKVSVYPVAEDKITQYISSISSNDLSNAA